MQASDSVGLGFFGISLATKLKFCYSDFQILNANDRSQPFSAFLDPGKEQSQTTCSHDHFRVMCNFGYTPFSPGRNILEHRREE